MAAVTQAVKAKDQWDFHSYGNVSGQAPERVWRTVEDLPRYTHNYWGVRNGFGILSETYSYLPFADRVVTNRRFLEEVLGYAHANAKSLMEATAAARSKSIVGQTMALRSRPARSAQMVEILMGDIEEDVNPFSGRVMHKRLDVRKPERMWEEATFEATESERVPAAYFVPAEEKVAIERLRAHGITLERLTQAAARARGGVPDRVDRGDATGVREPPGAHGHREIRAVAAGNSCRRLPRADEPAARAAGVLPARAAIQ